LDGQTNPPKYQDKLQKNAKFVGKAPSQGAEAIGTAAEARNLKKRIF